MILGDPNGNQSPSPHASGKQHTHTQKTTTSRAKVNKAVRRAWLVHVVRCSLFVVRRSAPEFHSKIEMFANTGALASVPVQRQILYKLQGHFWTRLNEPCTDWEVQGEWGVLSQVVWKAKSTQIIHSDQSTCPTMDSVLFKLLLPLCSLGDFGLWACNRKSPKYNLNMESNYGWMLHSASSQAIISHQILLTSHSLCFFVFWSSYKEIYIRFGGTYFCRICF